MVDRTNDLEALAAKLEVFSRNLSTSDYERNMLMEAAAALRAQDAVIAELTQERDDAMALFHASTRHNPKLVSYRDALREALEKADALIQDLLAHEGAEGFSLSTDTLLEEYTKALANRGEPTP